MLLSLKIYDFQNYFPFTYVHNYKYRKRKPFSVQSQAAFLNASPDVQFIFPRLVYTEASLLAESHENSDKIRVLRIASFC